MFKDDFTPEQNTINQQLFEDKQGQLEIEVGGGGGGGRAWEGGRGRCKKRPPGLALLLSPSSIPASTRSWPHEAMPSASRSCADSLSCMTLFPLCHPWPDSNAALASLDSFPCRPCPHFPTTPKTQVERLAKLIESPPEEILPQRMAIINLAANIDARIVKMYEVRAALRCAMLCRALLCCAAPCCAVLRLAALCCLPPAQRCAGHCAGLVLGAGR